LVSIPLQNLSNVGLTHRIAPRATHNSTPLLYMAIASGVALGLAASVLALKGSSTPGLVMALRLTARWSFLLFWVAYSGRAMLELFGPALAPMGRRGREFGLAYAAAQLIHVCLVVRLFETSSSPPLSGKLFEFFVIGIVWTYLLAVLSFGHLTEFLGLKAWRVVRIVGMNYILFAFAYDFVPPAIYRGLGPYGIGRLVEYAPFAAMCIAAPLLVLAASAHSRLAIGDNSARLGAAAN